MKTKKVYSGLKDSRLALVGLLAAAVLIAAVLLSSSQVAAKEICRSCSKTALAAFSASKHEAKDDLLIAIGNCYNLSDRGDQKECKREAREELMETREERKEQLDARLEICKELGEGPYDPQLDPADFVYFEGVIEGESFTPNRYFPLIPGTTWEYLAKDENGDVIERILVEVLYETKEIEYPSESGLNFHCIVVRDRVWEIDEEGEETLIEDTDDWYAQDMDGNVWYFGEISKEFEDGELVSLDGSWKSGVDSAKPGYLMLAQPEEGDYYRQEFFLGDAEDMGEVVSIDAGPVTVPFNNNTYTDDILQTRDWTPIEPDVLEYKFYAPGVGMVLEVNPEDGERVELIFMETP